MSSYVFFMYFASQCTSILYYGGVDPVQVVFNFGVDPIRALEATVDPPADDPSSPEAAVLLQGVGPTAVPLARVPPTLREAGTDHVPSKTGHVLPVPLRLSD